MNFLNKKTNKLFLILLFSFCLFDLQAMHTLKRAWDVVNVLQKRFSDFEENLEYTSLDLSKLELTDNEFSDVIIEEIKERDICNRIKCLNLSKNCFTRFPDLTCLENLKVLFLISNDKEGKNTRDENHLTISDKKIRHADFDVDLRRSSQEEFLNENIKSLEKIKELYLSNNSIDRLPKEIKYLKNLKRLDLSKNNLSDLPDELWDIKSLEVLNLSYNCIDLLPIKIGKLVNLKRLNVSKDKFIKEIEISNLLKERIDSGELKIIGPYNFYEEKDNRGWVRCSLDFVNYYLGRK